MSMAAKLMQGIEGVQDAEGGLHLFFPAAAKEHRGGGVHEFA